MSRKIFIAFDKFKGSIQAEAACRRLAKGILHEDKEAQVRVLPLADGGEGSCQVLSHYLKVSRKRMKTVNAAGQPVWVSYQEDSNGRVYLESSRIIGLSLLDPAHKNPLQTTSFGLGLCLFKLIQRGARDICIFLGGSATNDGGSGMLEGMGWKFADANGNVLHPRGGNLTDIQQIQKPDQPCPEGVQITACCDVDIPLLGINGSTYMFAAQKGAGPEDIPVLEDEMAHFQRVIQIYCGGAEDHIASGSGSAGGLGFGIKAGLGGILTSGSAFFAEMVGLAEKVKEADVVITGEGRFDHQSIRGKVVSQLISLAVNHYKPCLVVCGENTLEESVWKKWGVRDVYSISELAVEREESIQNAGKYIEEIGKKIGKR